MKSYRLMRYVLLMLILVLAACNGDSSNDDDTPEPEALLSEAASNINEAESFRLELRQSGAPTYFSFPSFDDVDITLNTASAVFDSPNSILAKISVSLGGLVQDVDVIAIEDRQYYNQSVITGGDWVQETLVEGFQPANLTSEELGIGNALNSMSNVTLVGNEEIESVPVYHIRGTVDAELARSITFGLMATASGDIQMNVYIRREGTRHIARIELVEPSPADAETDLSKTWEIDFEGYNQPVSIQEPDVDNAN